MPDGSPDTKILPEDLKAQAVAMTDIILAVGQLQGYVLGRKAEVRHFGQTTNGPHAGGFVRRSTDTLGQSLVAATQYAQQIAEALRGTVGNVTGNEAEHAQNFKNTEVL